MKTTHLYLSVPRIITKRTERRADTPFPIKRYIYIQKGAEIAQEDPLRRRNRQINLSPSKQNPGFRNLIPSSKKLQCNGVWGKKEVPHMKQPEIK
jgi:hypothetical protein